MIIDCISDMHGEFPELKGGDLLIIAGDFTSNDTELAWSHFISWLINQKYEKKILVAGNHDNKCTKWTLPQDNELRKRSLSYLCDSGTEFRGLKIWGSPWSLSFEGINPHCTAFTGTEFEIQKHLDKIPEDTDILITHMPPWGILDQNKKGLNCGHRGLRNMLISDAFPNLKFHVFGHIHECGGNVLNTTCRTFINASIMNEDYEAVNEPIRIVL